MAETGGRYCPSARPNKIEVTQAASVIAMSGASMASRADAYRANAAECVRQAASTRDPDIKAQFPDLARQWREMAELADRLFK
jgi:hypothetical protein